MRSSLFAPALLLALLPLPAASIDQADPTTWSDVEKERFLLEAELVDSERLEIGVTGSQRVTLARGPSQHLAHLQSVDIFKPRFKLGARTHVNFRDSYKYNIAAYRLDRMIGLGMVPVSVERWIKGRNVALTWWVDDLLMMEVERMRRKVKPPDKREWDRQIARMVVFDQLIYNIDFNMGNMLITKDWKIRLIDFTRAFRTHRTLQDPDSLDQIEPTLLEGLRGLDKKGLKTRMKGLLSGTEIAALLARRDRIVELAERLSAPREE